MPYVVSCLCMQPLNIGNRRVLGNETVYAALSLSVPDFGMQRVQAQHERWEAQVPMHAERGPVLPGRATGVTVSYAHRSSDRVQIVQ